MHPAGILVDLWHIRCGNCKVALHDQMATVCPVCSSPFDSIISNHVGLADKLERVRESAGVAQCKLNTADPEDEPQ